MTTKDTIKEYLGSLQRKDGWENYSAVDGDRACATTRYQLQPPGGPAFTSNVAEVFAVSGGRIRSLEIYLDSAAFPRR